MSYIYAIIYGIVQGVTEFLPVSSSGHLVILHEYLELPVGNELAFDVMLHAATLLAVVFYFRRDLFALVPAWFNSLRGQKSAAGTLAWFLLIATVPAGLAGYFFEDLIENTFRSPGVVALMLAAVGVVFLLVEKYGRQNTELEGLKRGQALAIGCGQALALIPGTSRSGITIAAGMLLGLKRDAAVRFSFLLSVPIIAGAALVGFTDIPGEMSGREASLIAAAFISAALSGFWAIKFFIQYTKKRSLSAFAYYRFVLAFVLVLLYLLG